MIVFSKIVLTYSDLFVSHIMELCWKATMVPQCSGSLDLMPGLQNWCLGQLGAVVWSGRDPRWLIDEERLPLSPVERLGFFDQSMAFVKCLAVAEAQSVVPRYRGHLLLPLLPFFYEAMASLKWPALGGKKAGDVVLVSEALARASSSPKPLLLRTTSAMQAKWMDSAQSLRPDQT